MRDNRLTRPSTRRAAHQPAHWAMLITLWLWGWLMGPAAFAANGAQAGDVLYTAQASGLTLTHMQVWGPNTAPDPDHGNGYPPAPANTAWRSMQLPDSWGRSRLGQGGSVWYMAKVTFAQSPQSPWALYLPRVIMNAEVWVNGALVGRDGRMEAPVTRNWNTPLLFTAPGHVWRAGINVVQIRVVAYADNSGGMAPPQLGPAELMAERHGQQAFWQNELVYAATISEIALGLFVLALWARKPERIEFLYFSLGSILWGVSNLNMTTRQPPMPNALWEWLVYVSMVWSWLFLCLFTLHFARQAPRWLAAAVVAFGAACALSLLLSGPTGPVVWGVYWLMPVLALGAWSMWKVAAFVRRHSRSDYKLLVLVEAITFALGTHDWLIQTGRMPFETPYGTPYVAPVLLAAFAWLIAGDHARTQRALAALNMELADRVRQKEEALRESFSKLADLERAQAVSHERHRIMRDMHDGVGMHLSSAIRQLQGGLAGKALIEQTLRDSLDHLKLTVDSMSLREGDVAGLLGSLRYRLTPRLQAAGLQLHWQVDALPHWPQGHIDNLRHLQYIVFEAVSNALQHAQASELWLRASFESGHISVCVEDNGKKGLGAAGVNASQPQGKGLQGMRNRAQSIGAQLCWQVREGGGCGVVVRWPLAPTN
jgi:signal transduction histidine kinase